MKENEIEHIEHLGDHHLSTKVETPLRKDAFEKSDDEKIENIQKYCRKIMDELGLDLKDDSLSGTPYRVAKMYVKELFYGLDPSKKPKLSTFENSYNYNNLLVEKGIRLDSVCEHHFLQITGFAHVGYIPNKRVIILSKINRLVNYYAHRPQVQERMCRQIIKGLQEALETESVIVAITAKHLCVSSRGIKDNDSQTTTIEYGGDFNDIALRSEFFNSIK